MTAWKPVGKAEEYRPSGGDEEREMAARWAKAREQEVVKERSSGRVDWSFTLERDEAR